MVIIIPSNYIKLMITPNYICFDEGKIYKHNNTFVDKHKILHTQLVCLISPNIDNLLFLNNISNLLLLKYLDLSFSNIVTDLNILRNLINIETLDLECCDNLLDITPLIYLINLKTLYLDGTKVNNITALRNNILLEEISLLECHYLESIDTLYYLPNLKIANIVNCNKLSDIDLYKFNQHIQSRYLIEYDDYNN